MQLVSVPPGCASVSESIAPPRSLSVSWIEPAANELAAFVVSLEKAEKVAAPLTAASAPSTSRLSRSFLATVALHGARELELDRLDAAGEALPLGREQRGADPQRLRPAGVEPEGACLRAQAGEPSREEGTSGITRP